MRDQARNSSLEKRAMPDGCKELGVEVVVILKIRKKCDGERTSRRSSRR